MSCMETHVDTVMSRRIQVSKRKNKKNKPKRKGNIEVVKQEEPTSSTTYVVSLKNKWHEDTR